MNVKEHGRKAAVVWRAMHLSATDKISLSVRREGKWKVML